MGSTIAWRLMLPEIAFLLSYILFHKDSFSQLSFFDKYFKNVLTMTLGQGV